MNKMLLNRLLSLDVFRGLTIVLMILVNSPGNSTAYELLSHVPWEGCSLADLVFPFFLFIVGFSSVLSLHKAQNLELSSYELLPKIIKRSIWIFLIGLALNAFPYHFEITSIRILGVLQRIAICYFFSAICYLKTTPKTQTLITLSILISYWIIWIFSSNLSIDHNFVAQFDQQVLGSTHLYRPTYDPEGILSTFPALATTLLGNLAAIWLTTHSAHSKRIQGWLIAGISFLLLGYVWSFNFPFNKTLWTSSFVLWTTGWALIAWTTCYWLIEVKHWKKWSYFFKVFGVNALLAYILHVFFLKLQAIISVQVHGTSLKLRPFITQALFGKASLENASLLYGISYLLLWFLVFNFLYRKKIFLKL